jgi:hypothetical protein
VLVDLRVRKRLAGTHGGGTQRLAGTHGGRSGGRTCRCSIQLRQPLPFFFAGYAALELGCRRCSGGAAEAATTRGNWVVALQYSLRNFSLPGIKDGRSKLGVWLQCAMELGVAKGMVRRCRCRSSVLQETGVLWSGALLMLGVAEGMVRRCGCRSSVLQETGVLWSGDLLLLAVAVI